MPGGDGTGPMGMGPMTGRGAGFCSGLATTKYANPGVFGCGFGRGRGFRKMFCTTGLPGYVRWGYPSYAGTNGDADAERNILNSQAEFLEKQLQQVKERLSGLKEDKE